MSLFLSVLTLTALLSSSFSAVDNCSISESENINDIDFNQCNIVNLKATGVSLNRTVYISGIKQISFCGVNTTIICAYNTGINVYNIESIEFHSIQFYKCGVLYSYQYDDSFVVNFQAAIYFFNISEILLDHLTVTESVGTGLVIFNCKQVKVSRSIFSHNSLEEASSLNSSLVVAGGGGVHVETSCGSDVTRLFDSAGQCRDMNLSITECSFFYNHARNLTNPLPKDFGETVFTSFGKGGGLSIHFRDNTSGNTVTITNSTFSSNSAKYGGGAEIVLSNWANSNNIQLIACTFDNNWAINSSGGLDIGFVGEGINDNTIIISEAKFRENSAMSGGAVSLFFLYSSILRVSSVIFSDVHWIENSAHYGAVLFAYPLYTKVISLEPIIQLSNVIKFIPGIKFSLPINVVSHLSKDCVHHSGNFNSNSSSFFVSIKRFNESKIMAPRSHVHTKDFSQFSLMGHHGDTGELVLTETGFRRLQLSLNIIAIDCPPLFKLNSLDMCECISTSEVPYPEFHKCNSSQAQLRLGFWIGYQEDKRNNSKVLLIGHCPPGFCSNLVNDNNYIVLPDKFDLKTLSDLICDHREGTLCGVCQNNYTVNFHAKSFICKETALCYLGPVFYFICELLPLTILFLIVIGFDIRFTSGNLNGFLFFAQMYNSITQIGEAFVVKSPKFIIVSGFHRIIYRFFDFDFFSFDPLSFCLFHTRSALPVVAFKYVTVVYALLLVFGMVWFLNKCGTQLQCMGLRQFRYSALQGLSAFLVIVYSQCIQVSFMILNFVKIYRNDRSTHIVPLLQGNINYFSSEHLPYAIPAIFCIFIIVLVPMLLLFLPLYLKFISQLRMEQNRAIRFISNFFPTSKLKPLLDNFQGSFKDEFRFFAGLYFVYRVVIIATILQDRIEWIYTTLEIELIVMFMIHVVAWPYQKRLHNVIDALIFSNLALIVILKHFTFIIAEKGKQYTQDIDRSHLFQLLLINAPLFVILLKIIHQIVKKIRLCRMRKKKKDVEQISAQLSLNDCILDDISRDASMGSSYMLMRERRLDELQT